MLDFRLNLATPFHFLQLMLNMGVVMPEELPSSSKSGAHSHPLSPLADSAGTTSSNSTRLIEAFENACHNFLSITIDNYEFYAFKPFAVACSIVIAAKRILGFQSNWNFGLMGRVSSIKQSKLDACVDMLLRLSDDARYNLNEIRTSCEWKARDHDRTEDMGTPNEKRQSLYSTTMETLDEPRELLL